jgi:hemerythrin-like metal-binding protein
MDAFVWDERFVTGLKTVDGQHRHLVDLVNKVGDFLLESRGDEAALQAVFGELASYATEHFREEEGLMAECAVDPRHSAAHTTHHREFVTQLVSMWQRRAQSSDPAAMLHGYLASWLTVHILGEDQVMARMIEAIRIGADPAAAYDQEVAQSDNSVSALLDALHKLYHVLSVQNRELAAANQSLESKVAERTQDLEAANRQLQKDEEDLRHALAHVEATQQQLLNSEKMASLGRMVAGFAHELNTPVGIAIGAVSNSVQVIAATERLLQGDEVSADDLQSGFDQLKDGNRLALSNLQRAAEMVQRLKQNSIDQDGMARRSFVLRDLIEGVLLGLKPRLDAAGLRVDIDCPPDLALHGVPVFFEQIFNTLLGNALRHAFPVNGRQALMQLSAQWDAAGKLKICCQDNGVGMTDKVAAHIFEPFYTTQRSSGRLGLGLYLCYNLVTTRLGGTITCASTLGGGTRMTLLLPERLGESK